MLQAPRDGDDHDLRSRAQRGVRHVTVFLAIGSISEEEALFFRGTLGPTLVQPTSTPWNIVEARAVCNRLPGGSRASRESCLLQFFHRLCYRFLQSTFPRERFRLCLVNNRPSRAQKMDPELDVGHLRPGVSDLRFMLPVLFSEGVRKGRISEERFVEVTSSAAAKTLGLYPERGVVRARTVDCVKCRAGGRAAPLS